MASPSPAEPSSAQRDESELSLSEGIATTRSIRRYTDEPVTEAQLNRMLFLATRAPSGSNRQPFRFVVVRFGSVGREVRELLAAGAEEIWTAKRATGEFPDRGANTPTARMLGAMDRYVASFASAPVIVLPCMIRYRAPTVTEGASIYPAVQNLLLGARAAGLGGALTMFHRPREDEIREVIGMPDNAFIAATITVGHPQGRHGPVRRKPLSQLVFDERWGTAPGWAHDPPTTRFTGGPQTG